MDNVYKWLIGSLIFLIVIAVGVLVLIVCHLNGTRLPFEKKKTITVENVSFDMIFVQGGTFEMGCNGEQLCFYNNELPSHTVTLSDYYIGETEVTQELWESVMGYNPSSSKGSNQPVTNVSYNDCLVFIQRLTHMTGLCFALPTEAQWEFAARGGTKREDYEYSGSNNIDSVAWYWRNSGDKVLDGTDDDWSAEKVRKNSWRPHTVKTKAPNELGIYDMSGNVSEWCLDKYGAYESSPQNNPLGSVLGEYYVSRGGDAWNPSKWCRVMSRSREEHPEGKFSNYGFRLVLIL